MEKTLVTNTTKYVLTIKNLPNYINKSYIRFLFFLLYSIREGQGFLLEYYINDLLITFNTRLKTLKYWLDCLHAQKFLNYVWDVEKNRITIELLRTGLKFHKL